VYLAASTYVVHDDAGKAGVDRPAGWAPSQRKAADLVALRFGVIQAALDDVLVRLSGRTSQMFHTPILSLFS
jgi:hypothetical protein